MSKEFKWGIVVTGFAVICVAHTQEPDLVRTVDINLGIYNWQL